MRIDKNGFTVVEIVLVILVVALIGFAGWMWYQSNESNTEETSNVSQEGQTEQSGDNSDNTGEQPDIPDEWRRYNNDELGFSFAYPQEWGEVTYEASSTEFADISSGTEYQFEFSDSDIFAVAKTTDFEYRGGRSPSNGFTDYQERREQLLNADKERENGNQSYSTYVVDDQGNDSSLVFADFDQVGGHVKAGLVAQLPANDLAGIEFVRTTPFGEAGLDSSDVPPEGSAKAQNHVDQNILDTFENLTGTIE